MRMYADPNDTVDINALGTGFLRTVAITTTTMTTDLPEYYVTGKNDTQGDKINYGEYLYCEDEYDYEDSLNMRKNQEIKEMLSCPRDSSSA
ncbi:hypothetical protein BG003_009654 [Podila horticola]|nr:hypothetical protein BG003_009654 [Podila horticola]